MDFMSLIGFWLWFVWGIDLRDGNSSSSGVLSFWIILNSEVSSGCARSRAVVKGGKKRRVKKDSSFHRMSQQQKAVERARKAFRTGRTKPLEYRIAQLKNLQRLFVERQKEIADALKKDLNKVPPRHWCLQDRSGDSATVLALSPCNS